MWIGVSGWTYDSWAGSFLPAGLPARRRLEYASRRFNCLEGNASFYSLLTPETCRRTIGDAALTVSARAA